MGRRRGTMFLESSVTLRAAKARTPGPKAPPPTYRVPAPRACMSIVQEPAPQRPLFRSRKSPYHRSLQRCSCKSLPPCHSRKSPHSLAQEPLSIRTLVVIGLCSYGTCERGLWLCSDWLGLENSLR